MNNSYLLHHSAAPQDNKTTSSSSDKSTQHTKQQMSDVMVDQRQSEDQAAPATARGHSKQSVNSATSLPTAGRARLQPRNTDIQSFADVRPVIQGWLRNYDQVFMPLEEKTGIPREMMFYIACAFFAMYLVLGSAAGLLCNFIGFAYPAYRSVIAIRTEQKDDDTQWLIYWTTFATFSVLDFFAEGIYHVMPLYWLLKLAFLLYLALPQTLGAHNLYVKYVDPAFDKLNEQVLRRLGIGGGRDD